MSDIAGGLSSTSAPTRVEEVSSVPGRWDAWLVGVVSLGTALLMWAIGTPADASLDPYYFGDMGRSIANGDGFQTP